MFPADFLTFSEEILNEKLHCFCAVGLTKTRLLSLNILMISEL